MSMQRDNYLSLENIVSITNTGLLRFMVQKTVVLQSIVKKDSRRYIYEFDTYQAQYSEELGKRMNEQVVQRKERHKHRRNGSPDLLPPTSKPRGLAGRKSKLCLPKRVCSDEDFRVICNAIWSDDSYDELNFH